MKKLKSKFEQFYGITLKTVEDTITTDIYNYINAYINGFVNNEFSELSPQRVDIIRENWKILIREVAKLKLDPCSTLLERVMDPGASKEFIDNSSAINTEIKIVEAEIDVLKKEIDLNIKELKNKEKEDLEVSEINKTFKEMTKEIDNIDKNINETDV